MNTALIHSSRLAKAWNRRQYIYDYLRQWLLFASTFLLRKTILPLPQGIILGANVRLQRHRSLRIERPKAHIRIGSDSIVFENARLEAYGEGRIEIGAQCVLGDVRIVSRESVCVGERVLFSWNVFVQDFDPHPVHSDIRAIQTRQYVADFRPSFRTVGKCHESHLNWSFSTAAIQIGSDVWIGAGAMILKGAQIGNGCVVGAGAVVPKGVYPPGSLIVGNPAVVKNLGENA
ncbi:MAG: acyltransferase [Bdellovibrionales bacterium]|nr:acyltransferase [Bdellovibrionales bacterium]